MKGKNFTLAWCLFDCLLQFCFVAFTTIPLIKYLARHFQGLVNSFLKEISSVSLFNSVSLY